MKWTHRFIQAIRPRVDLGLLDTVLIALAVHRLGHPGNEASGVPGPAPASRTRTTRLIHPLAAPFRWNRSTVQRVL